MLSIRIVRRGKFSTDLPFVPANKSGIPIAPVG
jgi:hypothetical protein